MITVGTLFVDCRDPKILMVCVAEGKGTWIADPFSINDSGAGVFSINSHDTTATPGQIHKILMGRDYPEWVKPILKPTKIMPKDSIVAVRPGAQLYNPPPPAPEPKMPEVMTLQTFQKDCQHKWMHYIGFSKVYMYCSHCDKKKDVEK